MAELPYPYYTLRANGPAETGFTLQIRIEEGAGGPLEGMTTASVLDALRAQLATGSLTTALSRSEVTTTEL